MYNGFICKTSFVEVVKCIFADGGVKAFIIESCSGTVGFIDSVSYFGKTFTLPSAFGYVKTCPLCKKFYSLDIIEIFNSSDKSNDITACFAAETVKKILVGRYVERGSFLIVERAKSKHIFTLFFKPYIARNNVNNIGFIFQFLYKLIGYEHSFSFLKFWSSKSEAQKDFHIFQRHTCLSCLRYSRIQLFLRKISLQYPAFPLAYHRDFL